MDERRRGGTRHVVVSFRLTGNEAAHLDAAGGALNHPRARADFARAAALAAARQKAPAPPARPIRSSARRKPTADVEALARILGQVGRLGGNVNQLARVANQHGEVPTAEALRAIGAEVTAIRQAVGAAIAGARS